MPHYCCDISTYSLLLTTVALEQLSCDSLSQFLAACHLLVISVCYVHVHVNAKFYLYLSDSFWASLVLKLEDNGSWKDLVIEKWLTCIFLNELISFLLQILHHKFVRTQNSMKENKSDYQVSKKVHDCDLSFFWI